MAHFLRLPPEILLYIYQSLSDIDDVLHLARTCKHLNRVFEVPRNRLQIFRFIIEDAPQHMFDVEICKQSRIHSALAKEFYDGSTVWNAPRERYWRFGMYERHHFSKWEATLPEEAVWEIVCRWQAMRVLFDLYCDSSIHAAFCESSYPMYLENKGLREVGIDLARKRPLPKASRIQNDKFRRLSAEKKRQAYQRFYRALTCHWRSVEALWRSKVQTYRDEEEARLAYERINNEWEDNEFNEALSDKWDLVEVVDFVWCFLGHKVIPVWEFLAWVRLPYFMNMDTWVNAQTNVVGTWAKFVRSLSRCIRPPDMIELLLATLCPDYERKLDKPAFLCHLGFFDTGGGLFNGEDSGERPDFITTNGVDTDVGAYTTEVHEAVRTLKPLDPLDASTTDENLWDLWDDAWLEYRASHWSWDSRGSVLFRDENTLGIVNRIVQKELSRRARDPGFSPISPIAD